jgi:dipeptidyl aminopeptidase/acylaminoacyl peptidase
MHDDLIDGAQWLVNEKIADPQRIAIMGGSYGGYATLAGLTFTPEAFACGVDIVGPSNLITLIKTIPSYWEPMKASFFKRVGDLKDEAFLKERSPYFHADKIVRPLLIGQGANDPRVKQSESDQIVTAMREKKLPVEYWVYTDEGHGFARPANRMHFYARVENFLAKHLGGRAEPVDDPAGNSAVQN